MRRQRKFALRSVDVRRNLDVFLVCAVASVLGNRVFLIITGYPQIGNSTLHISHAIWGALMMAISVIIAIAFLPPFTRSFIAVLGGAGFGWFIDELGKFITQDVNYFFQPTIALIYIVFVTMYLVFRSIQGRPFGPEEAVLNALEALKSAALGRLDETTRQASLALLHETGASGSIAEHVATVLGDVPALPPRQPGRVELWAMHARRRYRAFTEQSIFATLISTILVIMAIGKVVAVFVIADDHSVIRGVVEWASLLSSLLAGVFIVIGAITLHRSRLRAYVWFDRGLLVEILLTQVFVFAQRQLAGVLGLTVNIVLWLMVRSAVRAERERDVIHHEHSLDPDSASRPIHAVP